MGRDDIPTPIFPDDAHTDIRFDASFAGEIANIIRACASGLDSGGDFDVATLTVMHRYVCGLQKFADEVDIVMMLHMVKEFQGSRLQQREAAFGLSRRVPYVTTIMIHVLL